MRKYLNRKNISLFFYNLLPIFGVIYWGWKPILIIMLYVTETLLIGILHVLYMMALFFMNRNNPEAVNLKRENEGVKGGCLIPFFIFHFGFFVVVQMVVFFGFNPGKEGPAELLQTMITGTYKYALITLFVIKITEMISEFLWDPTVHLKLPDDVMFQPYGRIFVQQFMVILGGWFVMIGDKNFMGYLIILVIAKSFFDIYFANLNRKMLLDLFRKNNIQE